jgi:hypothetical protein
MPKPHPSELAYVAAFIHARREAEDFAEVYGLLVAESGTQVAWSVSRAEPSWSARYNAAAYIIAQAHPGYEEMFKRVAEWLIEEAPEREDTPEPPVEAVERLRKLVLGFCKLWDERSKDLAKIGERAGDLETIGEAKAQALCAKYLREALTDFR